MENMHHKTIKRFNLSGNIYDDSALIRLRVEYGKLLITEMKLSGYVPRLDIAQDFTIKYNEHHKYFEFELSLYGVFVGKKRAEWITGIDESRVIPTQQLKSIEFSREQA